MKPIQNIVKYGEMIKFGHTLFALPFVFAGVCLAVISGYSFSGWSFLWLVLAFTGARSAAMGFNRIADSKIDAANPRTKTRAIASGEISKLSATIFVIFSAALMIFSALKINALCFYLSFPALAVLFGYSYCKRFTSLSHFALGVALALAPIGAWIAVSGNFDFRILTLALALLFQISAFDIIYALQDERFDRQNHLHSIPVKFGLKKSFSIAFALFCAAAAMLVLTGLFFNLNAFYFVCTFIIFAIYIAGLSTIKKCGLKKMNAVFFNMNASCSLLIFLAALPQAVTK